mmetsp:Transcript_26193/g.46717  ORF Transcript_26193/g.46717 Transcript_26193/m.46717 type:complete len:276 (-) Transcript_26193:1516-2343(-)
MEALTSENLFSVFESEFLKQLIVKKVLSPGQPVTPGIYDKLNATFLRAFARELLEATENWDIADVVASVENILVISEDPTIRLTAFFYLMSRFHDIMINPSILETFERWVLSGLLDARRSIEQFAEYCLLPLLSHDETWRESIQAWGHSKDRRLRRTVALGFWKCAFDEGVSPHSLRLSLVLLDNSKEAEVLCAVGTMLRRIGRRRPDILQKFLLQHAAKLPEKVLKNAVARLRPNMQQKIMALNQSSNLETEFTKKTSSSLLNIEAFSKEWLRR